MFIRLTTAVINHGSHAFSIAACKKIMIQIIKIKTDKGKRLYEKLLSEIFFNSFLAIPAE